MEAENTQETMGRESPPPRYETRAAIDRVCRLLRIPNIPCLDSDSPEWERIMQDTISQDWDLILADSTRLSEFCDLYESESLDTDTRFALMLLILVSLDDLLHEETTGADSSRVVERVERLVRQDFTLHLHTLDYWRLHDKSDPDNVFALTPLIRRLWQENYDPVRHARWLEKDPG